MKKLGLLSLLAVSFTQAETIDCTVVEVIKGDTMTCVTPQKESLNIRLYQIDAPQLAQNFGGEARQTLEAMLLNQTIRLETYGLDDEKKMLATAYTGLACPCYPLDDIRNVLTTYCTCQVDVNLEMIKRGMAWHKALFIEGKAGYQQAQALAEQNKQGLWSQPNPVPPWDWQKSVGSDTLPPPR